MRACAEAHDLSPNLCLYVYVCVGVSMCAHFYIYLCMYIYVCVYVSACTLSLTHMMVPVQAWAEARDFIAQIKRDTESVTEARTTPASACSSAVKMTPQPASSAAMSTAILVKSLPTDKKETAVC
jgi:hypothetical protein